MACIGGADVLERANMVPKLTETHKEELIYEAAQTGGNMTYTGVFNKLVRLPLGGCHKLLWRPKVRNAVYVLGRMCGCLHLRCPSAQRLETGWAPDSV